MAYPVNHKCQYGIDGNVVALWHFNEALWDGTPDEVKGASGNGLHGVAGGGLTTVVGKFGRCGDYIRTSSQYVNFGNHDEFRPTGNVTIEVWVKFDDITNYQLIFDSGSAGQGIAMTMAGGTGVGTISFRTYRGGWAWPVSDALETGKWYYIVGVNDTDEVILYINGEPITPVAASGDIAYNNAIYCRIGGRYMGSAAYFDGLIDEVRISDIARSPEEIYQHYHQQVGNHII